jgi:hypothetical protein
MIEISVAYYKPYYNCAAESLREGLEGKPHRFAARVTKEPRTGALI